MAICGIYKITSPSGKIYIGQTRDWENRLKDYVPNQCKPQIHIYNSLIKYGMENHKFEIICFLPEDIEQTHLNNHEFTYWEQYKSLGFSMLNIREPGTQGKLSEETKIKISKAKKGKPLSEEHRKKCGSGRRGMKMSKEFCDRLSKIHKGKISKYRGIPLSEETKRKLSLSKLNKTGKPVIQLTIDGDHIKEWISISAAARAIGGNINSNISGISVACRKGYKHKGCKWIYKLK